MRLLRRRTRSAASLDSRRNPLAELKLSVLEAAMPAQTALVFGDVWGVHGAYAKHCLENGCESVFVIDSLETPEFVERLRVQPNLRFILGDFSDPFFMRAMPRAEVGVAFDVLLHQAPLVSTVHLMLEHSRRAICIAQPMLAEQAFPNSLVYLPGNGAKTELRPTFGHIAEGGKSAINVFDVFEVNHGSWLWGMTRSFLENLLLGEGFELVSEFQGPKLANPNWHLWGCVAERTRANPAHWSASNPYG